jgi:glycerol-3-phosphate cytidylyltransferase
LFEADRGLDLPHVENSTIVLARRTGFAHGGAGLVTVTGYVPGVWDLFHVGHLNLIKRARERCDVLVVGVVTDDAVEDMKGYRPVVPWSERADIVRSLRFVDAVIPDESLDKRLAWHTRSFDVLFKGDDWKGTTKGDRLEKEMAEVGVTVSYFPYTEHTSSTILRDTLSRLARSLD